MLDKRLDGRNELIDRMRMEMLGHSFFIFKDIGSDAVCVVYQRYDGGYGVIETE